MPADGSVRALVSTPQAPFFSWDRVFWVGKGVFFSLESLCRQQKVSVLSCIPRIWAGLDAQAAPGGVMSAPASATTETRLGLAGEELKAQEGAGTWPGGHQAGGPCPKPGELGVPACAPPGEPSSGWPGQRVQPRGVAAFLTRSLAGARAAGAALASSCLIHRSPGRAGAAAVPALSSRRAASPPAVGFKVGGCVSLLFLGCDGWAEGWGVLLFGWVLLHCGMRMWDEDASQAHFRMRMEERGSPSLTLVLLSPSLPQAGAVRRSPSDTARPPALSPPQDRGCPRCSANPE